VLKRRQPKRSTPHPITAYQLHVANHQPQEATHVSDVAPTLAAYGSLSRGEPTSLAQIAAAIDACDVGS